MKNSKPVVIAVGICGLLCLFLLAATSGGETAQVEQQTMTQWGVKTQGLQMSISAFRFDKGRTPEFEVTFRNVGEQDAILNLGVMLGNGQVHLPDNIRLSLTDANGKTRELLFSDKRYSFIAGRMDDYIVPLRAGSVYTLKLGLDQFWSPATNEVVVKLSPGKYQASAQYEGKGANAVNLDTEGIKLMNFWKGKLQSNTLTFEKNINSD